MNMTNPPENTQRPIGGAVEVSLSGDATAPAQARTAVRETLLGWRLPTLVESCVLAVSELVTNALRHGIPPFGLLIRQGPGNVRIEVNDARPEAPESLGTTASDVMSESGRGLGIVRELADELGTEAVPGDGKNVYAAWKVDPEPTAQ